MEFLTSLETGSQSMPPGVTSINELRQQKRVSRTLSKAVSLHLEGKLESAARLLTKALESGEREAGLFSALGHIHYEMRNYEAAAEVYSQLAEFDPKHRTAHFNLGVCYGHLKNWRPAAESFAKAVDADGTRSEALLGLGISQIHAGRSADALDPLDKYLILYPENEQALFA